MANLLDNAIKYTPEGGTINITLTSDPKTALLTVDDTGPGIAKKDRERIFDRFYRADVSRSTPGSGLGLALVQSITAAHRGTITVKGNGVTVSQFLVRLPKAT